MNRTEHEFLNSFSDLQRETFAVAKAHGFHDNLDNPLRVPTYLALIGSEVSEALAAHRKQRMEELPAELADIVIRTMDLAESLGINLALAIVNKNEANRARPYKHGNNLY